jgi:cytochrome c5
MSVQLMRAAMRVAPLLCVASAAVAMGARPVDDEEAVNRRIQPLARIVLGPSTPPAAPGSRTGEALYKAVCSSCHGSGVAGAPKLGDSAAWAPRLAQGLTVLIKSSTQGKNAMPPKGSAADATTEELARAVVFMANQSGGKFAEPQ